MSVKKILNEILTKRILIIDGAMGSYIKQKYKEKISEEWYRGDLLKDHPHNLKGNNDVLCLTQPKCIQDIHDEYFENGADFATTCTFASTNIEQKKYGLQEYVYKMNYAAAKIAKDSAKKYSTKETPKFVLGSVGPTSKTLSISTNVNDPSSRDVVFDDLVESYYEQIRGLVDGGSDVIIIETIFDVLNAKSAIYAATKYFEEKNIDLPIFVSATIEKSGRTLSGETPEAFFISVQHSGLIGVGVNCGQGADVVYSYVKSLSNMAKNCYITCYPNAGYPNEFGEYDHTPEIMAGFVEPMLKDGFVNIIGGCCGTTPPHIKAIYDLVKEKNFEPRKLRDDDHSFKLCGIDHLINLDNFIHVGERCNVAGSRFFKNLITKQNFDKALSVARKQVENGAEILDICVDEPLVDSVLVMRKFLNLIVSDPFISKVPIMIDSSNFDVIIEGLKCLQGKAVVNSISLKNGEDDFVKKAKEINKFGAAIIVMAFDENAQAVDAKRKIEICKRSYDILVNKVGVAPENIIFDPNVLTIGTGIKEHDAYALEFLNAIKPIKEKCPFSKVSGGLSNLSFAFRGLNVVREVMHSAFLYHGIKRGMDMAIVNMGNLPIYANVNEKLLNLVEDLIFNRSTDAAKNLLEFAKKIKEKEKEKGGKKTTKDDWRTKSVEERLKLSLLKGTPEYIRGDIEECVKNGMKPLEVVEGPLMKGMDEIGVMFGSGQMFLPQVIQSARVMKCGMDLIFEIMKNSKEKIEITKKKILLATVKDDVHDIGKNIVGCILECNNYEVIDLGVMVECKDIIKKAKEEKVDVIGMSALITPSLEEMIFNVKYFKKEGIDIPILIGGASTSEIHTAVKISPHYFPVIHVADASQAIRELNSYFKKKDDYLHHIQEKYKSLREEYYKNQKEAKYVTLEEARKKKFVIDWKKFAPECKPSYIGDKVFEVKVDKISDKIFWMAYFWSWGYKPKFPYNTFPEIFKDEKVGKEAKKLYDDSLRFLEKNKDVLIGKAVLSFYPSNSEEDDIHVYEDATRKKKLATFHGLRQQLKKENEEEPYFCLSDFVAPVGTNVIDHVGLFVGSIFGEDKIKAESKYEKLMKSLICDRLAEALAEYLHEESRKVHWGYSKEEKLNLKEIFKGKYQGIRPAIGYPSQPDHQEKKILWKLLDVEKKIGTKLTESTMMMPRSSTCSVHFSHTKSEYFSVGKILKDQIEDYSKRKNEDYEKVKKSLCTLINY